MKRSSLLLLALCIAIPQSPAKAQEDLTETEKEMLAGGPDDASSEQLSLHLADAVAMGIENNLSLQVQRFDPLIAFAEQESSWGAFDPLAFAGFDYLSDTDPIAANRLFGNERNRHKETNGEFGVDTLLPYLGASLSLSFDVNETKDIGNPFINQRPVYNSGVSLAGSVPLLKGLIWNQPWTRVNSSRSGYEGSRDNFTTDLMDTVQSIETSYWALVAQIQAVRVAEKSLETARSLLDQTQTQYEVGVKSKVEVVEAEAGVAAREFELIRAVNLYLRAQDDLIDAVLGTKLTAATKLEIQPADDPENYIEYQIDVVEAAERALQYRPELAEAESFIEIGEFQLKFAKNQRLPQLDLTGTYGPSGRVGEGVPAEVSPGSGIFASGPTSGNSVGDTFDDYWSDEGGELFTVGAVFSIPIGNISGRHDVSKAELELRRAHTRLIRLRQDILLQVRDGARNLQSAQEGIDAAERRRIAAEEQLRAEKVRLEYGESTPFRVLEKEEDLVEAENEKIFALFTYRKSVVDLHRAQGTILQARNIVVEEAAPLR